MGVTPLRIAAIKSNRRCSFARLIPSEGEMVKLLGGDVRDGARAIWPQSGRQPEINLAVEIGHATTY